MENFSQLKRPSLVSIFTQSKHLQISSFKLDKILDNYSSCEESEVETTDIKPSDTHTLQIKT